MYNADPGVFRCQNVSVVVPLLDSPKCNHVNLFGFFNLCVYACGVCCIKEYNQCMESARSGGQEVDELKQALSDARVQCKALELKNTELLRAHSQLAQRIKKQVR